VLPCCPGLCNTSMFWSVAPGGPDRASSRFLLPGFRSANTAPVFQVRPRPGRCAALWPCDQACGQRRRPEALSVDRRVPAAGEAAGDSPARFKSALRQLPSAWFISHSFEEQAMRKARRCAGWNPRGRCSRLKREPSAHMRGWARPRTGRPPSTPGLGRCLRRIAQSWRAPHERAMGEVRRLLLQVQFQQKFSVRRPRSQAAFGGQGRARSTCRSWPVGAGWAARVGAPAWPAAIRSLARRPTKAVSCSALANLASSRAAGLWRNPLDTAAVFAPGGGGFFCGAVSGSLAGAVRLLQRSFSAAARAAAPALNGAAAGKPDAGRHGRAGRATVSIRAGPACAVAASNGFAQNRPGVESKTQIKVASAGSDRLRRGGRAGRAQFGRGSAAGRRA